MNSTQQDNDRFDVFLAHASDDRDSFVVPLVKALRAGGVSVWYSEFESPFATGSRPKTKTIQDFLLKAMQTCSTGILVVSRRFLEKPWPMRELDYWLSRSDAGKLTIVTLGVTTDDICRSSGASTEEFEQKFTLQNAELGPSLISLLVISKIERRTVLRMIDCSPPTDIVVFPEMGCVAVAQSGGLFGRRTDAHLDFIDFSGRTITDRADRVLNALWRQLEFNSGSPDPGGFDGHPFQFKERIKYAYLNHLHMNIFSPAEVERGCFLNAGTSASPYVISPFFTCDSFTAGTLENKTTPFIDECLRIARGTWRGNWRRLVIGEDGQSFFVVGED